MNREDYAKVKKIFQSALELAPGERAAFLDEACAGDEYLRREAERLLDSVDSQFLETPAVAGLADVVIGEPAEEPTKILPGENAPARMLPDSRPEDPARHNELRPGRVPYILVCLMLLLTAGLMLVNFVGVSERLNVRQWLFSPDKLPSGYHYVGVPSPGENVLFGDELVSINGEDFSIEKFYGAESKFRPGDRYILGIRREGLPLSVELVVPPVPPIKVAELYVLGLIVPAIFLLVGAAVFLLRPNDKAVLLYVTMSCLFAFMVAPSLALKDRIRHEQKIKVEVLARFDEGDDINLLKECAKCGRCFDRNDEKCDDDGSELTFSLPVERTIENRYKLEKLLGKGGMGIVYEATDLRINRRVAVKVLGGGMFGNRDALRRFEREAQTAGRLHHHNIVTIFDYGVLSTEGAFLVMELIGGESLGEVLKRESRLDPAVVSDWFFQVLDGVECAHKAGIVHRDLKPENIFVSSNESGGPRLRILDFGLARLSETEIATGSVTVPGTVIGTFGYMPSEQLRGEKVDERTDLFAVAVMIYEALHGAKPFAGKSYHELLTAMSNGFETGPDTRLPDFFKQGLANNPGDRFASAAEMKANLSRSVSALQR